MPNEVSKVAKNFNLRGILKTEEHISFNGSAKGMRLNLYRWSSISAAESLPEPRFPENTTIAISNEIKEQIKQFGHKGETYSEILSRILVSARKRQLHDLLMNEDDSISIEEAISNSKKRWQK